MQWLLASPEVAAVRHYSGCEGVTTSWPSWVPDRVVRSLADSGVEAPWEHQAALAERAFAGEHMVIATPTGTGKSLAYWLPIFAATTEGIVGEGHQLIQRRVSGRRHTALYLAPTKALAHDQMRAARRLAPPGWSVAAVDGDSNREERLFARDVASVVLTNPDMLHFSILPNHQRWVRFLRGLRYVVIDEAHRYQGVFGAHVANVVRRLRRLAAGYGAHPVMILSSATVPNAASFSGSLVGEPSVGVVDESTAPAPARSVLLWRPRDSVRDDTARLLAQLSDEHRQTLAFVPSRAGAELVSVQAQELATDPLRIASYRGGYLAMERRALEAALHSGEICGLATTNALELGIDVAGIDCVLVAGFPGRKSAFWQQIGRAGRAGQHAWAVLLARENPLDAYVLDHPATLLDGVVEDAVVYPENPHVMAPHLAAAAQEMPLTVADERFFGPTLAALAANLSGQGVLRDRGQRWYWTRPDKAVNFVNLRSTSNVTIDIVERDTGAVLGVVSEADADRTVFPGAVYLHQGQTWLVREFRRENNVALVESAHPGYYTQAQAEFSVAVLEEQRRRQVGLVHVAFGAVQLTSRVTGYLRRDEVTHEVMDSWQLTMPLRQMRTQAVWWCIDDELERTLGLNPLELGAALHAAEHTAIGILPLLVPCDRSDIGGLSTAFHVDTGQPTVFVYDGLPGGAGFAKHAFERAGEWLAATVERLQQCPCDDGCPACVVSPKCGNANQMLNKAAAREVMRATVPR